MTSAELISFSIAIISIVGAIASAIFSFTRSASNVKNDVINAYEKRVTQLETDMKNLLEKIKTVQDTLNKRESELKILTDLLQGRDPQMQIFMETVLKAAPAAAQAASEAVIAAASAKESADAAKAEATKVSSFTVQNGHMLELLLRHFQIPLVPGSLGQ